MSESPTHRLVKTPKVDSRHLSDYMVASERKQRTIIRDCKYRKIARAIQHDRAKAFIAKSLRTGSLGADALKTEGQRLLDMMADSDFDRSTLDVNGDFLIAYGDAFNLDTFPTTAEIVAAPKKFIVTINGVEMNPDIRFATQRVTRTNRLRTGLGTIRYAKNKPLNPEAGVYQSSALFGCRKMIDSDDETAPEEKLCLTLDCVTGAFYPAPTDATRRFQNMEAACATISERWDNIEPPAGAVLA
ncbi:MAG: hypothetical protein AAGC79_02380 [Pseudomonadota bacterium]